MATSIKPAAVERVEARTEQVAAELKVLLREQGARDEGQRSSWEDKLTARQMNLEHVSNE